MIYLAEAKAHTEDQKNLVDQLKLKVSTDDSKDQEICELEKTLSSVKTELIEERKKMTSLEETFKRQLQESVFSYLTYFCVQVKTPS